MQLKLDELLRTNKTARDTFVSLEDISDEELAEISKEFSKYHQHYAPNMAMRKLHQKVQAEHAKRLGLAGAADYVMDAFRDPQDKRGSK
jgi:low affinity Fe/Cu permease